MRILFVTKPHLPVLGGAQLTTHYLAEELVRRGHAVTVLAQEHPHMRSNAPCDTRLGYLTIRSDDTEGDLPVALREHAPDCVVVGGYHQALAPWTEAMLKAAGAVATVLYAHDIGITLGVRYGALRPNGAAAVSGFVADELAKQGVSARVIRPIVERARYLVTTTRRVVLFVNPVEDKGVELALRLAAARPDIPFAFVRCWYISPDDLDQLRRRSQRLPNVELRESVHDAAQLYADARIVLMPSRYPEAWGRVGAEAVAAGIPVLGTAVGGIADAVGRGGILLDPDAGLEVWAAQLGSLWDNEPAYARLAARAEAAGRQRRDVSAAAVGSAFEELICAATGPTA
jgi:glycosyltransferase involved in cell wall biosynthesis